jgi:hypothetical protein
VLRPTTHVRALARTHARPRRINLPAVLLSVLLVPFLMFVNRRHQAAHAPNFMTAVWLLPVVPACVAANTAGIVAAALPASPHGMGVLLLGGLWAALCVPRRQRGQRAGRLARTQARVAIIKPCLRCCRMPTCVHTRHGAAGRRPVAQLQHRHAVLQPPHVRPPAGSRGALASGQPVKAGLPRVVAQIGRCTPTPPTSPAAGCVCAPCKLVAAPPGAL